MIKQKIFDIRTNKLFLLQRKLIDFLSSHNVIFSDLFKNILFKFIRPIFKIKNDYVIISTLYGVDMIININDLVGKYLLFYGEYERDVLQFLKKYLKKGDIMYDIGAYIGDISLFSSLLVGSEGIIYSFEPVPDHLNILKENIILNKIKNIHYYETALGAKIGVNKMYFIDPFNRGSDTLVNNDDNIKNDITVNVTTIDNLIRNNIIKNPNIIKIDVEGYELNVLLGAKYLFSNYPLPFIIVEYNSYIQHDIGHAKNIYLYLNNLKKYDIYYSKFNMILNTYSFKPIDKIEDIPNYCNIFCLPKNI